MLDQGITYRDSVKPHTKELAQVPFVYKMSGMSGEPEKPFAEQGRRLRWLRQALRIPSGAAFAAKYGWAQSGYSQFETGARSVPRPKILQLRAQIPGFDPLYIWDGEKRGLSFPLLERIEAEEAKEMAPQSPRAAKG
jgi:hypothetical protein